MSGIGQLNLAVFIFYQCMFVFSLWLSRHKLLLNEGKTGPVIERLAIPQWKRGLCIAIPILLCSLWIWVVYQEIFRKNLVYSIFPALILLAEIIIAVKIIWIPDKICEKGILTERGFYPWVSVKKILDSRRERKIWLKVQEDGAPYRIELDCKSGTREFYEQEIRKHLKTEEKMVQQ